MGGKGSGRSKGSATAGGMNFKTVNLMRRVKVRKRRLKVESMILRGVTNRTSMAVALGVNPQTIANDIEAIGSGWLENDIRRMSNRRTYRVKQLMFTAQAAWASYERSKQDSEEVTTVYIPRQCPTCKGKTADPVTNQPCDSCNGTGKIMTENVTRKIKGQPGDSTFLQVFKSCVIEAAKLENLYRTLTPNVPVPAANVNVQINNTDLSQLTPETLLRIKQAMRQVDELFVSNGKVVDLVSQEIENDENEGNPDQSQSDSSPA